MNTTRNLVAFCTVLLLLAGPMNAQVKYFPAGAFGDPKGSQEWIALYSKYLKAMKEPSLLDRSKAGPSQSYRFLWLRSFHKPVSVRLDIRNDGGADVTVKVGEAPGVSALGGAVQKTTRTLSKREVDSFLDQVNSEGFWKLPAQEEPVSGPDGARWILEGARDSQYHVAHRWTPKDGTVRTLCLYLAVELAQMKLANDEIY